MLQHRAFAEPVVGGKPVTGRTLVTMYDRIFLIGQSFMPAVNDLLLGILLYQSRLVPRALSMIGIIGGVIGTAVFFGSSTLLKMEETHTVLGIILRRIRR